MKVISLKTVMVLSLAFASLKSLAQTETKTFVIPANKAYAEPFTEGDPGVQIPVGWVETRDVVSNWRNKKRSVVWYLYQKMGSYSFALNSTISKGKSMAFELKVSPTEPIKGFKPITKKITLKGTGENHEYPIESITVPKTAYFRYELKPLSDPSVITQIHSWTFRSSSSDTKVNQTEYQSSPSVHLTFSTTEPTGKKYNWIYEEILVPEGGDPLYTYYMSLGFFRGYMGIQTNSSTERRVLFSVWDSKDAENDKTIEAGDYVTLVDKDPATTTNSFGGEGTGGQSYVKTANWKTGKPVKFLMNILKSDNNSVVVSAWYKIDTEDWKYVASWRAPKEKRVFDGFYSFIENFGYSNGQLRREAYYYNAWGFDIEKNKWINFNKVRFSNTDGRVGERVDFEQGVSPKYPNRFYMASGGYTSTLKTANEIPLSTEAFAPDLKPFEARVQQALENEKNNKNK